MKNRGLFVLSFLMAAMSFTVLNSCDIDIGLGAAIDTEVPILTIENPPTGAVIRDAFVISGSYSDDGEISRISLDLRNTENNKSYSFTGKLDDDSSWSADINPLDEKSRIPDGKYEVKITIADKGGHKSNTTRSFTIDNTAPVLVLSRPSSIATESDENKIESYGQNLTLEGQISDANDIDRIVMNFYDGDKLVCPPKVITNIPPTISLDVAKFHDNDVYSALFGNDINKTENTKTTFYCTITAYDSAKRYPLETEEDELGNPEDQYILMSDWQNFQLEYQAQTNSEMKLPDLYSIKSGMKKDETTGRYVYKGNNQLISLLFDGTKSKGSFRLNPKNNPTFLISTLDLGDTSDVESDQPLTVQLFKGLDGISLKNPDKMSVYLQPISTDEEGKEVIGAKIYPQKQKFKQTGDGQIDITILRDDCKDKSPIDEDIEKANSVRLEYGAYYILGVEGKDIKGNEILPSLDGKKYRICFKAKKQAPELKIESPVAGTSYIAKGQPITISGTTSIPDGMPTISITYKKDDEDAVEIPDSIELEFEKEEKNQRIYKFSKTLPKEFFDQKKSHQYLFEITSDMDGWKSSISKTIIYDVDGPTISIDSMLPTAEKYDAEKEDGIPESGSYLNGDVKMKIAILDDYDSVNTEIKDPEDDRRPKFIITDKDDNPIAFRVENETEKFPVHYISTPTKQEFTIHTEDIPNGKIKVKIFAEDRAGNLGVDIDDLTNTSFVREYIVDQSTDAPVILPYNPASVTLKYATAEDIDNAFATADDAKEIKSVFTTGSTLQLKLIDDDGIESVTFKRGEKDTDENLEEKTGKTETQAGNPTELMYTYQLPTAIGKFKCSVTVKDTKNSETTKTFWIVTTGAAPVVSITSAKPDNKIITLASENTEANAQKKITEINLEIDSGYKNFTVSRFEKINGTEVETVLFGNDGILGKKLTFTSNSTSKTFTDSFEPSPNRSENKIRYVVTDEVGHSGEREFSYYVDNTAPVVDADSIVVPSVKDTEGLSFRFKSGTASDTAPAGEKESGIAKIQFTFDSAKASANIKTLSGISALNETVLFGDDEYEYAFGSDAKEGKRKIYVRAIDEVGNIGSWVEKEFVYDTSKPNLSITSYKHNGTDFVNFADNTTEFDITDEFALGGKVSDDYGIKNFEIWQKKEGSTYENSYGIKLLETANPNKSWTIDKLPRDESNPDNANVDSGSYIYTIVATDKADKSTTKTITANIDITKPIVTFDTATASKMGQGAINSSPFMFSGTVIENTPKISGIYYKVVAKTNPESAVPAAPSSTISELLTASKWTAAGWTSVTPEASWSFYRDIATGEPGAIAEGKYYLYMYAVDGAGNVSERAKQEFHVDMASPVITATAPEYVNSLTNASGSAADLRKVVISGTIVETNELLSFTISRNGTTSSITPDENGNWTFIDNPANDGKYTYTIKATDLVGKTDTITKNVTVDTSKPVYTADSLKVGSKNWNSTSYYKDTTLKMSGTYTDATSGIDTLFYYIQYPGRSGQVPADLTTKVNGNIVADGEVSLKANSADSTQYDFNFTVVDYKNNAETPNTLYIQTIDNAGNKSDVKAFSINIDTSAPELTALYYKVGEGTIKEAGGTVYVNGTLPITVYGNYKDAESGAEPLTGFKINGTSIAADVSYSASTISSATDIPASFGSYSSADSKAIRSWKAVFTPAMDGKFEFEGRNGTYDESVSLTGGKTAVNPFKITLDTKGPSISNVSITPSNNTVAYKKTESNGTVNYYVNNQAGTTFTFAGVSADSTGVDTVKLEVFNSDNTKTYSETTRHSEWSFTDVDLSALTGTQSVSSKVTITVTDIAGNSTTQELHLVFDTTAPKAMHWADANNKDIYFRIGSDTGSKYSYGSWGNDSTIEIRGTFDEASTGSGLKAIHYAIFDAVPTSEQISAFEAGTLTVTGSAKIISSFAPLSTADTQTVSYSTNTSGGRASKTVTTNFRTTLSGFNGQNNYLVLVAEDNVGNRAADTLAVNDGSTEGTNSWNSNAAYYSINKDTQAPSITSKATNLYTNGTGSDIIISGTASDALSGLANVTLTIEEINFSREITEFTGTAGNEWSTTIPVSNFAADTVSNGKTYTVYAKATDNAGVGNSKQISAGTIVVDKKAPAVKINSSASVTKDKVTFSGTVNDGTGAGLASSNMILYYTKSSTLGDVTEVPTALTTGTSATDAETKWVQLETIAPSTDWSLADVDLTEITGGDANTTLYFTIAAKDAAGTGNTGYANPCSILVDRNKPVLTDASSGIGTKLGSANVNNVWFNSKTLKLSGAYTDEGGSGVTTISYQINTAAKKDIQTTDGSYDVNISDFVDGSNTVTIWAKDKVGIESEHTTYTFNIDSVVPVIASIDGAETTKTTDVALTINITDKNPVAPTVVVKDANSTTVLKTLTANTPTGSDSAYTSTVTIPFASEITTDGFYDIEVTVKDKADNTSAVFTKRIVRDHVAPTITITKPASESGDFIKSTNYKFEGTITDATCGIETATAALYKVTGNTEEQVGEIKEISLDASGNWVFQAYELDAADYIVKINATDIASNAATETVSPIVKIDSVPPKVTVTSTGLNYSTGSAVEDNPLSNGITYYANGNYSIKVKVEDLNYVYAVTGDYSGLTEITAKNNSNEDLSLTKSASIDDNGNTVITINPSAYADGLFTYTIKVGDKAGNKADDVIIKVHRDTTGPSVGIKNPTADITDPKKSLDADTYSFRINANDGSGVGVSFLYYLFSTSSTAPTTSTETSWVKETFTDGDKIIEMKFAAGKSAQTTVKKTELCEGKWYLHSWAKDKSGNASTVSTRKFSIDKAVPVLSVTQALNEGSRNVITVGSTGYALSGTVSDSNELASLVLKVDGVNTTITPSSGTAWSTTIATGTDNGKLKSDESVEVELTATDIAGKTTTKKFTLYNDTKNPELEITAPVLNEPVATLGKVIKGTASDDGYGIGKVEYKLFSGVVTSDNESTATVVTSEDKDVTSENFPVEIKGEQWYIEDSTNGMPLGTTEGSLTLKVTATENKNGTYGGRSTSKYVPFYFDKANPELKENVINTAGKTTKDGFTLGGKVWDSNAIASLTIKCGNKTWVSGTDSNITITPTTSEPAANNWTATFVVGITNNNANNYVADGINEFTIIATDSAGKTTQITRTVTVDTQKPDVGDIKITSTGTTVGTTTWYKTSNIQVTVDVTENGDSGISKVEYLVDGGTWTPLSNLNDNYQGTVRFTGDGASTFKIRATDVAGNISDEKSTIVNIDTSAPELTSNVQTVYTNGNAVTVTGTVSENENASGVKDVVVSVEALNFTQTITSFTEGNWTATISADKFTDVATGKTYTITATASDNAGNQKTSGAGTIIGDKTAPEVKITASAASTKDSVTLSGTANDKTGSGLASDKMILYYTKSSTLGGVTTVPTSITVGTDAASSWVKLAEIDSGAEWSESVDTTSLVAENTNATLYFTLAAKDKSGTGNTGYAKPCSLLVDLVKPVSSTDDARIGGKTISQLTDITWFNNATLVVSGKFTDTNGSGVKEIIYKLDDKDEVSLPTTDGTYNTNISGFKGTGSTLTIKAKDAVGNESTVETYTVKIDSDSPVVAERNENDFKTTKYTNAKSIGSTDTKTYEFDITDKPGSGINGISSLEVKVGSNTITNGTNGSSITLGTKVAGTGTNPDKWPVTLTIGRPDLALLTGNNTITVTVNDVAGNKSTVTTIGSLTADNDAPKVTIKSPVANAKVAKEFTISGTASDGVGAGLSSDNMILYYTTNESVGIVTPSAINAVENAANGWKQFATKAPAGEWDIDVDSSSITTEGQNNELYFTLTCKDTSGTGNTGYATPVKVVVDRKGPAITDASSGIGTKLGAANVNNFWFNSKTLKLSGVYTDESGSGVTTISYQTNAAAKKDIQTTNGSCDVNISDFVDGSNTVTIWATDKVGNESEKTTYTFNVDSVTPAISSITGAETTQTTDVELTINITDKNPVAPTVKVKKANQVLTTLTASVPIGSDSTYTSTVTIPFASGVLSSDGTYDIEVTVKDKADNTSAEFSKRIVRDHIAPTVSIINPEENSDPFNGTSYTFRFNANDGSGIGVTKLLYAFGRSSTAPAEATSWTEIDFTGGDKNIDMPLVEGKTAGTDTNGKVASICEGDWYVFAKAVDKAGNETATAVSRAFKVDMAKPTLTVSGLNESGVNALYKEISNNKYIISGTVSDTNALATNAVTLSIDGQNSVNAQVTGNSWTYNLSVGIATGTLKKDELVSVKVTARDITNKTTEKEYTLYYDTKDPVLEVTAPVENEAVETGTKVIKGTVSDGGYGIQKLEYKLYRGSETTPFVSGDTDHPDADNPIVIKGEQWYISKNEGKVSLGTTEGALRLEVTATENKPADASAVTGKREYITTKTVNFYYDTANPELTEGGDEGVGTRGKTTNAAFKLDGTASDSNALESITIKWKVETTDKTITLTPTESQLNSMTWSQNFVVGSANSSADNYVADGTNEFTIIAKDISGKEKQLTRTVIVDTVAPTCGTPSITSTGKEVGTGTDAKTWYNTSFINIKLENVKDENGTGISKVEYTTETGDSAKWYPMSDSGTTYTATVNCTSQGENSIRVKVTDAAGTAGNEKMARTLTAYIDTKAPTLGTSKVKYLSENFDAVSELLINASNGYQLQIEASDAADETAANNSGVASVTYSYGSKTIDGTKSGNYWIIEVPTTGNGTNNYSDTKTNAIYAIIKDNAGNEIKERILTVTKDTTDPKVEIVSFTRAGSKTDGVDDVNGTITISGTASDTNKFGSVKLEYQKDGETSWTEIATKTDNSWTTTLNTKTLDDNTKYTIKATAIDAAGNSKAITQDVYVNQDSDRPVITVTNMTLATAANETSFLKRTSRLEGTVSDDDGNVSKLEYSTNGTSWTEATLEYGTAWSIPDLPEGENKLYFRVTDKVNTTPFTTAVEVESATAEAANQPKIKDQNNTYVSHIQGSLALKFKVVTKQPDVDAKQYQVFNSSTNAWETRETLGTLGGIYTKFKISLKAKSEAFIGAVQAKYATGNYDINFTCVDTNYSDKEYHTWTSTEIALDASKTEIKLKISDASSTTDPMTLEQTITYAVDNTTPEITIKEPASTVGVKETMQFDIKEEAVTYYAVTKNDVTANAQTGAPDSENIAWTQIEDTSNGLTRYVFFDDDINVKDHTDRFALYLTEATTEKPNRLDITTVAAIDSPTNPFETITKVKFWVKAVDNCGNIGYASKEVNVDPQGNRPTVTLGYPADVLKDGVYVVPTLGGTIRLDGNVSDDIAAKYVWVKIERENADFSGADVKFLKGKEYPIGDMTTNELLADATITALADNASVPNYAIRVPVNGTGWNLSINNNQEFNVANNEAHLKFKIYATDADQDKVDPNIKHIHRSAEITQQIVIDSRTPYISASELRLVKYENGSTSDQQYNDGASVHGIWYLQGKIRDDDSGLKTVQFKKNSDTTYTDVITVVGQNIDNYNNDSHFYFKKIDHTDNSTAQVKKYDYEFSVPLGNSTSGQVGTDTITIKAIEATDQNLYVEQTYSVTYDNKAPEFNTDTDNPFVKLASEIYNSSGFYTFGAIASEDAVEIDNKTVNQSGVERIAFYFTRDLDYGLNQLDSAVYTKHSGTSTHDLFDIMIYHSNVDAADVNSGNMIVGYQSGLTYSNGLYWRTYSGTSSGKTFTYTNTTVDPNIHAGGLVKIGGVIYKIESVSGKTISVASNISGTSADFALCNVIDRGGEKNGTSVSPDHGYGFGYYPSRSTDDGDLITETFNSQGTSYIFDASINSKNLPDGPITLHMIAFDKAGNVTEPFTMTGTVKNNAPRIAGLILGTDENGNGSVDEEEVVSAYSGKYNKGYDTTGNEMHDVKFPVISAGQTQTSLLTVKGLTVVKPEIIGGNGAISYSYKVGSKDAVDGGNLKKDGSTDNINGTTDDVVTGSITLPVSAFIGTEDGKDNALIPDGELSEFKFTFGDSTPGTSLTDTTGKNSATMTVYLDVALRETNKAKNWILPFYWKSKTDNSLFKQSADEGHIELAADWVTTTSYTGTTGEYDADPKVSGKIKIEGIAQDDTLLREIKVQFGKSMGGMTTADTTIATYDFASGKWGTVTGTGESQTFTVFGASEPATIPDSGWVSYVKQATYQDLLDAKIITAMPSDKEASSKVPYASQDFGHVVHWILYLDTAKVAGVAATDVTVTATATDRGTPKWNSTTNAPAYSANAVSVTGDTEGEDETTIHAANSGAVTKSDDVVTIGALTGRYRMDVVPYITEVVRGTDDSTKPNKFNTNRARSGAVSLRRGDVLNKIKGFNLNGASVSVKITPNKNGSGTAVTMADVTAGNDITFTVSDSTKSGYLHVEVNSITAMNNVNCYKDYNSETNTKAYDHNTLTDDRYVHIWRVSQQDTFKGSKNAVYPAMARGSDGTLYASFTNYGQSKVYYTNNFTGDSPVDVSNYKGGTVTTDYWGNVNNYTIDSSIQTSSGVATLFNGYDPPEETDISVGPDGNVNVFYAANYHGGNDYQWGDNSNGYPYNDTDSTNAGGIYVFDSEATDTYFGRTYHNAYRFELYTYDNELNQFRNIRVNRTYDSNNTTAYVNVAYYDRLTGAIKYSYTSTSATETYTQVYGNTNYAGGNITVWTGNRYNRTSSIVYGWTNNTNYNDNYVLIGNNYYKIVRVPYYASNNARDQSYYYTFENYTGTGNVSSAIYSYGVTKPDTSSYGLPWVVIDGDTDVTDTNAQVPNHTTETFSFTGGWSPTILTDARYSGVSRTTGTGESLSLTANGSGYPIIFYMDAGTGQPRIAFANSRTPNTSSNWTVQGVFASTDDNYDTASDYMSCLVDSQGYLHIAFQNTKGQLVYAKSKNNPSNGTTAYDFSDGSQVLDDSGMYIDMTMNGTTPYISYLSRVNSYDGMKIAFKDSNFDENNDGVAEGGWETMTAALNEKVTTVRTCIEPNAKAYDTNSYTAAVGFCPGLDYRAAFYVGQ